MNASAPDNQTERLEAALLRARTLLRIERPQEALAALARIQRAAAADPDAEDAVATLRGIAFVRTGESDAGFALLEQPLRGTDPYVRAERAYYLAFALWMARRLTEAEAAVRTALDPEGDVMQARALGLLGWIETSRSNYARGSEHFLESFEVARTARHRDEHLLVNTLQTLSSFAFETLDQRLARDLEQGFAQIHWSADLAVAKAYVLHNRAWSAFIAGRPADAWRLLNDSLAAAPEPGPQIHAHLAMSTLHRTMGSRFAAKQHLDCAHYLVNRTTWSASVEDDRMGLLEYASEAARLGDTSATQAIIRYQSAVKPVTSIGSLRDDSRSAALERHAFGLVAKQHGSKSAAGDLEQAADAWGRIGYHMRHAQALLDLHDIRPSRELLEQAARTCGLAPRSWLRAEVARRHETGHDVATLLSTAERRVMRAICEGKSAKQIAADLGRSVSTVNNQTRAIYDALGVRTRAALIAKYGNRFRQMDAEPALAPR